MGASVRPESAGDRISRNVAAMRSQGASDHDVEAYLTEHEGLKPEAPASASPRGPIYNAINTADSALTFGLGQKFNSAVNAGIDAIRGKDSFSHSYTKNLEAEQSGLSNFAQSHPYIAGTAGAIGNVGQAAALLPLTAASGVAQGARLASRAGEAARLGGALGAASAVGNAPASSGPAETMVRAGIGGAGGALLGGAAVPIAEGAGAGLSRVASLGQKSVPAMARVGSIAGGIAAPAESQSVDAPSRLLINRLSRAGFTPSDALSRLETIPADKPVSIMEIAGDASHPLRQLGKLVARTPSSGASVLRTAVNDRMDPLTNANRVLGDVGEAMGVQRTNLAQHADVMNGQRLAAAKPHYDEAFSDATPHVALDMAADENGPTLNNLLKRPSLQQAIRFHNEVAAERGDSPLKLPRSVMQDALDFGASARDGNGMLRRDLSNVSDEELNNEWQHLAELNATEEASHAGVKDSGYRMNYEELPRTERLGHKGKEDLPDADGEVDPERLLADNKTVAGYNRNQIVRAARDKAMQRLQLELDSRRGAPSPGDATDFNFGENADKASATPAGVPLKSLQQLKFKLDDMLGFAKQRGQLPDGTPATRAKLDAINETRKSLLDIMNTHSRAYGLGNESWAGSSALQNAGDAGRGFLSAPIDEVQNTFGQMSPAEREQHNISALSGPMRDRLFKGNAIDRAKILSSPDIQERMSVVTSPDRFATLKRNAGVEHQIALTGQGVLGGSDTFENALNAADAHGSALEKGAKALAHGSPKSIISGLIRSAVDSRMAARLQGVNEATANALGPRLSAGMSSRADLQRELEVLAFKKALLEQLTSTPRLAGLTAGSTVGRVSSGR